MVSLMKSRKNLKQKPVTLIHRQGKKSVNSSTKDNIWKLKWVSSVVLMFAMILTAQNIYPYNLFVHFVGILGWLIVAINWNDRALIVVNSVAIAILTNGLFAYFVKVY